MGETLENDLGSTAEVCTSTAVYCLVPFSIVDLSDLSEREVFLGAELAAPCSTRRVVILRGRTDQPKSTTWLCPSPIPRETIPC